MDRMKVSSTKVDEKISDSHYWLSDIELIKALSQCFHTNNEYCLQ